MVMLLLSLLYGGWMKSKDPSMQILPNDSIVQLFELKNYLFFQNAFWKEKHSKGHLSA